MTTQEEDLNLMLRLAAFIGDRGYAELGVMAIQTLDTGVVTLSYNTKYPAVRVERGKIIWPTGSPTDLVLGMLG